MPFLSVFSVAAKVPEGDTISPVVNLDVSCLPIVNLHIPVKLATDSGVIRPPIGAKRRWCIIIPPSDRNGSRQTSFFSWILP